MRYHEVINENAVKSYRLFHGSQYPDIKSFRLDNLRHRTGTPGTLSFTTSIETAKIYGKHVYEAEVSGNFGDYLNPDHVKKVFDYRWPRYKAWHEKRGEHSILDRVRENLLKDIEKGEYALWENVHLWKEFGWDGAWCHESGSRNLIVGNINCVKMIGNIKKQSTIPVLYHGTCEDHAQSLCEKGWAPNQRSSGANQGQSKYLYLTTTETNAMWFANEKGCSSIVAVKNIPNDFLAVDPEDGMGDSVEEEMNNAYELPGYLVLTKPLPASHFEIAR